MTQNTFYTDSVALSAMTWRDRRSLTLLLSGCVDDDGHITLTDFSQLRLFSASKERLHGLDDDTQAILAAYDESRVVGLNRPAILAEQRGLFV